MVSIDCFHSRTSQIAHVTKESIKINDEFYCYDVSAVRLINKNNDEKDTSEEGSNILEPFGFLYKCTVLQTTLKSKSQKGGINSNNNVTDDSDEDNQVKVHFFIIGQNDMIVGLILQGYYQIRKKLNI